MFQHPLVNAVSRRWMVSLALMGGALGATHAAEIQPLREAHLDAIFSQASFGSNTIDIRFNPGQTIYNADWRVVDVSDDGVFSGLTQAAGLRRSLTIPLFYVDAYTNAGAATNTVGLAWINAGGVTVKADFQADLLLKPYEQLPCGPELSHIRGCYIPSPAVGPVEIANHAWRAASVVAHELVHNLGLFHLESGPNLMNATLRDPANYTLNTVQVSTILQSRFVQTDAWGQRFISITPFAVLSAPAATPVPEPATWALVVSALAVVGWRVRGRAATAMASA